MKKTLSLILALAIALSLAACGGRKPAGQPAAPAEDGAVPTAFNYPTAENPLTISLGHSTPEKSSGNTQAAIFKEYVEEKTGGAVLVDIYPNSQLGNENTMLEGVYSGSMDAGIISGTVLTTVLPEANAWYLPFMFEDLEEYSAVMHSDAFYEKTAELIENKTGMHYLGIPIVSPRGLLNTKRAVASPEDMKGLTVRGIAGEIITDIFAAMGASTTQLSFGEVYTGLQQGVCDGVENGLSDCIEMKFVEVAKYYTDTIQCMNGIALLVSDSLWQKLSPEQQEILREAGRYTESTVVENQQNAIDEAYVVGAEEYGVTVTRLTDGQRTAFRNACLSVYEKYQPIIGEDYYSFVTGLAG
ncbi:MAG: TRAP transporter substrate-binding protein [Oscillibacter sp.]|jgi:tripartite ATP-independent transporter DctP family solute receptor|nr:TRAP transporter substrate-binding protein [Oscillibacter sp.]